MKIDLHVHTDASDGKESVETVFERASSLGLDAIAISDHDTTANWSKAAELAVQHSIGFVPAIEVTTRAHFVDGDARPAKFGVHMLAYLPDPTHQGLVERMKKTIEGRVIRLQEITETLAPVYGLTWDAVLEQVVGDATLGRPAVADALIAGGHFENRGQVFDAVWYKGSPHYVPNRAVPDTIEAIELIRSAGGVAVIAHPLSRVKDRDTLGDKPLRHFEQMIEAGLGGVEAYHREVEEQDRDWLLALAERHDLIVTGSSDYHGLAGKDNELGEYSTSLENLRRIAEQATGTAVVNLAI